MARYETLSVSILEPGIKYTVATVPDPTNVVEGSQIYVVDGAGGSPVQAFSDGTNWLRCDSLAPIS